MDEPAFLTGQMLIAMPGIGAPRFERALIYVIAHDEEHAMGLAVNRPAPGLHLGDLLEKLEIPTEIEIPDAPVLVGGPVQKERGFVLHTDDYAGANATLPVADGVALTATRDVLEALGSETRRPRRSVMALGYAGWGAGQLEQEIRHNVWLTCPADEALLFGEDFDHKWGQALAKLGVDPSLLTAEAGRA